MAAIKCTKSTKLIEFQYRFLHQTLATNVSLVKMGYTDDITFCHEEAENFTHLFWFCSKIELFWKRLIASLKDCNCLSDNYLLNNLVVLDMKPDTSKNKAIINFVLLLARFYIWLCRSKGNIPTIENFKPFLNTTRKKLDLFLFGNFYQFRSLSLFTLTFLPDIPYPLFSAFICKINNANFSVNQQGKYT